MDTILWVQLTNAHNQGKEGRDQHSFSITPGSVAGEVRGGRSTYICGIVASLPLISTTYIVPIVLGYWVRPDYRQWDEGYFQDIADQVGAWLGVIMVVASGVSNLGMANALLASLSRTCWAMAKEEGTAIEPTHEAFVSHAPSQARHRSCPLQ